MAQEVLGIMQQAIKDGVMPGQAETATPDNHQHQPEQAYHPTPTVSSTPMSQPVVHSTTPAPPPPMVGGGGPKPPPPPPAVGGGPKPPAPPPPSSGISNPKPSGGGGGGGTSLLEQIHRGTTLKPAQIREVQTGGSTGNPLADTLLNAMSKYRVDIEGKDDDEDDW